MCSWYRSSTCYCHLMLSASVICSDWYSTGSTRPNSNWTTKFRSQRTSHIEPSATSTTVTGPIRECLQAGTEDAPVLDRPAPLRRLRDSGARYKYPDLLTYLLTAYCHQQMYHSRTIFSVMLSISDLSFVLCCRNGL